MAGDLFAGEDMSDAVSIELDDGRALVYSTRAPDKQTRNEDAVAVIPVGTGRVVCAVADGLGGQRAGGTASELALEKLKDALVGRCHQEGSLRAAVLDGIESANHAVLELGIGAATTLAVAEISAGSLRPYHIGDSAVWVVGQRGRLKLQTVAHSPVGYALEAGVIDESEALHHDERHLISNNLGSQQMRIEVGSPLQLAPRDTVLLATDGLFDNLSTAEIVDGVRINSLEEVAQRLVRMARSRMDQPAEGLPSKPDDLTFALFRMGR